MHCNQLTNKSQDSEHNHFSILLLRVLRSCIDFEKLLLSIMTLKCCTNPMMTMMVVVVTRVGMSSVAHEDYDD